MDAAERSLLEGGAECAFGQGSEAFGSAAVDAFVEMLSLFVSLYSHTFNASILQSYSHDPPLTMYNASTLFPFLDLRHRT